MKPNRLTLLILLNLSLVLTAGQSPDYDSIFRNVHTRIERHHAIREPHLIAAISALTSITTGGRVRFFFTGAFTTGAGFGSAFTMAGGALTGPGLGGTVLQACSTNRSKLRKS